jgi:hypothetical protein
MGNAQKRTNRHRTEYINMDVIDGFLRIVMSLRLGYLSSLYPGIVSGQRHC